MQRYLSIQLSPISMPISTSIAFVSYTRKWLRSFSKTKPSEAFIDLKTVLKYSQAFFHSENA